MCREVRPAASSRLLPLRSSQIWALLFLTLAGGAWAAGGPAEDPAHRLQALFAREWEERLARDPLLATSVGRHEHDDRLPSVTAADQESWAASARRHLEELAAIDRSQLSERDQVSYDLFESQLREGLEDVEFRHFEIPILVDDGFHIGLTRLPDDMPFQTVEDYERYIARLRAVPEYFRQNMELMRAGLERGFTLPRVVLKGYEGTISSQVVEEAKASLFYRPFDSFPATVPAAARERLAAAGEAAIREAVVPAYRAFLDFFVGTYLPGCRETLGASELPRGREYYASRIRQFTTLDLTPEEIHRLGLAEVARIRQEMEAIPKQLGFQGDFAAFLQFLRTDPRFYAKSPEELLKEASWIAKRMDGKLPSLFKTLPRMTYGVEPVPAHIAPKYTAGRYVGTSPQSTQPGLYWVNTYALDTRPLYALPALTLHEAVPGHHLQNALAKELEDLPEFRRFSYLSAFGEGWGLYSEWLGIEAGIYTDPYVHFGRLTYEMWRACRLVVDTGLHAFGWSRQQALDTLASNTALSLHEVETETDRYISWPGQALAYKLGEMKIRELRRRAEEALGERFDVREFHDAVLRNGSIPLPVLEKVVDHYIASQAPKP